MSLPISTQQAIEQDTGIPFTEIADMDWEEIDSRIEQKTGKKLTFHPCNDTRRLSSGSVLLQLGRLLLPQELNRRLNKIKIN